MKIKNTIALVLFASLAVWTMNSQRFLEVAGTATDVTISPKDGSVYVVSKKNAFKYNPRTKKFERFGKQSKNVLSIADNPNGSIFMVSTSNQVYVDVNGRWNLIPGIKTKKLDVDKDGTVRALDLSGKLHKLYQGKWQRRNAANKNASGFNQVIGQNAKVLYARVKDNSFQKFTNGKWIKLNGKPVKITMDDRTGDVYAVGRNKGIYAWHKPSQKWKLLPGTRKDLKDVAVQNGKIWALGIRGAIYTYDPKATPNGHGTYRVTLTRILAFAGEMTIGDNINLFGAIGAHVQAKTGSFQHKLKPLEGSNRMFDHKKDYPAAVSPVKKGHLDYQNPGEYWMSENYNGSLTIRESRDFLIEEHMDLNSVVFDIQANISQKRPIDMPFGWHRKKVSLVNLVPGKEYFFSFSESAGMGRTGITIGFTIERIK